MSKRIYTAAQSKRSRIEVSKPELNNKAFLGYICLPANHFLAKISAIVRSFTLLKTIRANTPTVDTAI